MCECSLRTDREEALRSKPMADDAILLSEVGANEEELVADCESMGVDELEELNGRMGAKALYLSKVRPLAERAGLRAEDVRVAADRGHVSLGTCGHHHAAARCTSTSLRHTLAASWFLARLR